MIRKQTRTQVTSQAPLFQTNGLQNSEEAQYDGEEDWEEEKEEDEEDEDED